jgi:hypothetical protein
MVERRRQGTNRAGWCALARQVVTLSAAKGAMPEMAPFTSFRVTGVVDTAVKPEILAR